MTQFAFVFPGQGSQAVGMLAEMAAAWPVIEETFGEASAALGYDLWALTQQGPAEELNKTWQTQPALLAASVALYRVWQQQGAKRQRCWRVTASANTPRWYARALSVSLMPFAWLSCVVNSCRKPYRKVPAPCPRLSVWTTPLSPKPVKSLPKGRWSPVNYNSPGQVVIAGHKEAVERAGAACKAAGLNARCRCR